MPPLVHRDGSSSYFHSYVEINEKTETCDIAVHQDSSFHEFNNELNRNLIDSNFEDITVVKRLDTAGRRKIETVRFGVDKRTQTCSPEYNSGIGKHNDELGFFWYEFECCESIRGSISSCKEDIILCREDIMDSDDKLCSEHKVDEGITLDCGMLRNGTHHDDTLPYGIGDIASGDIHVEDMKVDTTHGDNSKRRYTSGEIGVGRIDTCCADTSLTHIRSIENRCYIDDVSDGSDRYVVCETGNISDSQHSDFVDEFRDGSHAINVQLQNDINELRQDSPISDIPYRSKISDVRKGINYLTVQRTVKVPDGKDVPLVRQHSLVLDIEQDCNKADVCHGTFGGDNSRTTGNFRFLQDKYISDVFHDSSVDNVSRANYGDGDQHDIDICYDAHLDSSLTDTSPRNDDTDTRRDSDYGCRGTGSLIQYIDGTNVSREMSGVGCHGAPCLNGDSDAIFTVRCDNYERYNFVDGREANYIPDGSSSETNNYCSSIGKNLPGGELCVDDSDDSTCPPRNTQGLGIEHERDPRHVCDSVDDLEHRYIETQKCVANPESNFLPDYTAVNSTNVQRLLIGQMNMVDFLASKIECNTILPKLDIPKFSGNIMQFCQFMASFDSIFGTLLVADAIKLNYLIQFCDGLAKECIEHCVLLDPVVGYCKAREILAELYGSPYMISHAYISHLVSGPVIKPDNADDFTKLYSDMYKCYITLSSLGRETDIDSTHTLLEITRRLPMDQRHEWAEMAYEIEESGAEPIFKDLLEFVKKCRRISSLNSLYHDSVESDECLDDDTLRCTNDVVNDTYTTGNASQVRCRLEGSQRIHCDSQTCLICSEKHAVAHCSVFKQWSVIERTKLVWDYKLCFNCFESGHRARECLQKSNCVVSSCFGKHHVLLHKNVLELYQREDILEYSKTATMNCGDGNYVKSLRNREILIDTGVRGKASEVSIDTGASGNRNNVDAGDRGNRCSTDTGARNSMDAGNRGNRRSTDTGASGNRNSMDTGERDNAVDIDTGISGSICTGARGNCYNRCIETGTSGNAVNMGTMKTEGARFRDSLDNGAYRGYPNKCTGLEEGYYAEETEGFRERAFVNNVRSDTMNDGGIDDIIGHVKNSSGLGSGCFVNNSSSVTKESSVYNDVRLEDSSLVDGKRSAGRGQIDNDILGDRILEVKPRRTLTRGRVVNGVYILDRDDISLYKLTGDNRTSQKSTVTVV